MSRTTYHSAADLRNTMRPVPILLACILNRVSLKLKLLGLLRAMILGKMASWGIGQLIIRHTHIDTQESYFEQKSWVVVVIASIHEHVVLVAVAVHVA